MSDITARATTEVFVNGQQAKAELDRINKKATELLNQWRNIGRTKGFDSKEAKKYERQLKKINDQYRIIEGNVNIVNRTLANLNTARPHELRLTLRSLKTELQGIERGSAAWDAQVAKIRAVDRELKKVNADMAAMKTPWEKFTGAMGNGFFAIVSAIGVADMFVQAGRNAVNAFAEMDQEMASVRKFTGMTEQQVEALNDEFKRMDTRTSREELNKLAQEAGRLGLQSQEDVLGFVRAANQINVALDDLGDGATLTLSKLTDIFGDKERLGVEQSLLSVGSVINELSQNCTASAPYLAEFASRLGGVGNQAGLTIQQIMGFGAVLDSQNQKVEASSTALGQVIVKLYRDPAKYAAAAGLDVQKFTDLLKKDANEALLTLLETLNKAGGMDVLSPMFADMGENGARAISTLSTLAGHIDDVRAQQMVAVEAFDEATSVTKEYNVQNNTAQAQLEKAKKRFQEMTIELGQRLMPVMRYAITSGSTIMRVMSGTIGFIYEHKTAFLTLASAIGVYTAAVKGAVIVSKFEKILGSIGSFAKTAGLAIADLGRAINFVFLGQLGNAKAAMASFNATVAANPLGALLTVITTVSAALAAFSSNAEVAKKKQEALANATANATQRREEEAQKIAKNIKLLESKNLSDKEQATLIERLNKKYGPILGKYESMADWLRVLKKRGKEYCDQIYNQILAEGKLEAARQLIAEAARKRAEAQDGSAVTWWQTFKAQVRTFFDGSGLAGLGQKVIDYSVANADAVAKALEKAAKQLHDEGQAVLDRLDPTNGTVLDNGGGGGGVFGDEDGDGGGGGGGGKDKTEDNSHADKLKAEKDYLATRKAMLEAARASGKISEREYQAGLLAAQKEYYDKAIAAAGLSEKEKAEIEAEWQKQKADYQKQTSANSLEDENEYYKTQLAEQQQFYLDGKISKQTYDLAIEQLEIDHLQRMASLYAEGTKEKLDADNALNAKLVEQQARRQKETEDAAKKHEDELKKIKEKYFGLNETERKAAYDKAVADLKEAYSKEIAAVSGNEKETERIKKALDEAMKKLAEEFDVGEATGNILDRMAEGVNEWLNGEGGKALTGTVDFLISNMSAIFSQLSSIVQAEAEIEQAKLDKRYDREISRAEGNNQKVKALEKKKAEESAKIKSKAAQKEFNMQVIMAIAQTALAGLNAYSSTAAIPIVGPALAPAALALAVATGMLQVAALKKQKEASEAQGYAAGGFTPAGPRNREVGVVHAGEWVASQDLVKNPVTRPVIDVLEAAQRNNTIPSPRRFESAMSSRSATIAYDDSRIIEMQAALTASLSRQSDIIDRLNARLNEPFVTVNTVAGDTGIKRAQDDYQAMINRTLPKSRRS